MGSTTAQLACFPMTKNNLMRLAEAFPIIYRDVHRERFPLSICCGNGWFPLIWELSALNEKIARLIHPSKPQPVVVQVKEKFGGLRFYLDHTLRLSYSIAWRFANVIEEQSYTVCEFCGGVGKRQRGDSGWVKTACQDCFAIWNGPNRWEQLAAKFGE